METIKEHIKSKSFSSVYLLYGSEPYLKRLYRDKLKNAILGDDDGMNFHSFEGKVASPEDIIEIAETLPFFSEKRLIIIENSNFFKSQNPLADYLKDLPETTHLVFVENEVDKRNRLYKMVAKLGTVSQMNGLDEKRLTYWVASLFKKNGKSIHNSIIRHLIDKAGTDMEQLSQEIEKLICYAIDRTEIEITDIDEVCTSHPSNEVFRMVDAVADGKQETALSLYHDLLALREKPMGILYLLVRQFNILIQILDMPSGSNSTIASKVGVPPFTVNKYRTQGKRFTSEKLIQFLRYCADMEENVKKGKIHEQLAVEILIIRCSTIPLND